MHTASPRSIGSAAETRVVRHLLWRGWRICARNWVGGGGELDIVASRWRTLLVVEVRHRAGGTGLLSVDRDKLQRTLRSARALIERHDLQRYRLRIDIIASAPGTPMLRQRDVLSQLETVTG